MYGIQFIYPSKNIKYYCEKAEQRDNWLKALRTATGYTNIKDIYEVLVLIYIKI
jgi:hypothetical protein